MRWPTRTSGLPQPGKEKEVKNLLAVKAKLTQEKPALRRGNADLDKFRKENSKLNEEVVLGEGGRGQRPEGT